MAILPVDTDDAPAFGASPSDFFVDHKLLNSKSLDIFKILDHAHVVLGSISFIHVFQIFAGKTVASKTKFDFTFLNYFAIFDFASDN